MGRKQKKNGSGAVSFSRLKALLLAGTVLAAIKVIFVDYALDEEYQVVMAYRRLAGDYLFDAMWEPHQTSAFACVWLMRLFLAVTGSTTGVVLFLRVCTTLVQSVLARWLYRVCCHYTRREYAFLLGLSYFNIIPKLIQIPEFSNLQLWFFTVIVLSLMQYYETDKDNVIGDNIKQKLWLILAGTGMAFEVLSYPSCLVLFPFFLICIFVQSKRKKDASGAAGGSWRALKDCLIFSGVCGVDALIWLGYVLHHISLSTFLRNVGYVLAFDLTHDISLTSKLKFDLLPDNIRPLLLPLSVTVFFSLFLWIVLSFIRMRKEQEGLKRSVLAVIMVLVAEVVQVFYWVVLKSGYEKPLIHLLVLMLAAILVWRLADSRKKVFLIGLIGSVITIVTVIYMSDLSAWYAIPHGMLGSLFAVLILIYALDSELGERSAGWAQILLVSLVVVSIFGKGFTLRDGRTDTNSVLGIRGIVSEGPTAGIFMNYMQAYITNSTYEEFEQLVEEGTNCLIVTNMVGTAGTSPYLFRDSSVCHFSIIDPTSYDEKLLTYWSLYPDKQPDVIVVDCWYGQLIENKDSWIIQYIESDFNYSRTVDGKYLRYYFR